MLAAAPFRVAGRGWSAGAPGCPAAARGGWRDGLEVVWMRAGGREFPRWVERVLSVAPGMVALFAVAGFVPAAVLWAVTGDAELGRRAARIGVAACFSPALAAQGVLLFLLPCWSSSTVFGPWWPLRCAAVGLGSSFWGAGAAVAVWSLGGSGLLAARVGLPVFLAAFVAGWLVTGWLGRFSQGQ